MNTILVTGGAGYIGSHVVIELVEAGYNVVIYDNLSNSSRESINRMQRITGKSIEFFYGDILDKKALKQVFTQYSIDAVMHFAGLKAVGESILKPLLYYKNNVQGSLSLFKIMQDFNVKKIIFSSSATVYGKATNLPITEYEETGKTTNPYGQSKYFIENILHDLAAIDDDWNITLLRYFNPVGAHHSGLIGEDPMGQPNNLMPLIAKVAIGRQNFLTILGDDYNTPDGTGVRDYIHVVDLAKGHLQALKKLNNGIEVYNLGTGQGYSVIEVIKTFEKECGKRIKYKIGPRRNGDIASSYADVSRASSKLGWNSTKTLNEMCKDTWHWQSKNPNGYN